MVWGTVPGCQVEGCLAEARVVWKAPSPQREERLVESSLLERHTDEVLWD